MIKGSGELSSALWASRYLLWAVALFSIFVNLLMLTGPIFMLQVYDRVLGSRSEATLIALVALVAFLFGMMGLLDIVRGRVMARVAAQFQSSLAPRVFAAMISRSSVLPGDPLATAALRDLDAVQRMLSSSLLLAIFDLPFVPIFVFGLFIFHPLIGWLAILGGATLIGLLLLNQVFSKRAVLASQANSARSDRLAEQLRDAADLVQSLGMRGSGLARWDVDRSRALVDAISVSDSSGLFSTATRIFRFFLQSALLAAGAWLVLRGELTSGAMIASSIILGRALAPVEQAVGGWALVQRASEGWRRLASLLAVVPLQMARTALPRPRAILEVSQVSIVPPGQSQAALRMVSFRLEPGQALGVIGPSGAGKSSLAAALTGVWRPAAGMVRLDGATLDQYDPDVLGQLIGYLPQRVALFDGTIAENIARMALQPDAEKVVSAAKKAAAHQMIVNLPDGYDTRVMQIGGRLSGGQIQRIGLARAFYDSPVLLVLDEPNSNLDNEGSMALNMAIRGIKADGGSVLIMAHRPAAIQECELLLVLDGGISRAFGPRDEVLRKMVQNSGEILNAPGPGGIS